ncbi:MAG: PmoA family protein [Planctomycetes bacterium]|nr:PmoA family protein [Planctomycetota bacterium]
MEAVRIALEGNRRAVSFCPVSVQVPRSRAELSNCELFDLAAARAVPFQAEELAGRSVVHWIVDSLAPGQSIEYVLRGAERQTPSPQVRVGQPVDDSITVEVGGEMFTRYIYGEAVPKPCLYPLIGPFGMGLTRAYPQEGLEGGSKDHVHHRSLYVAWGDVNGSDNWGEGAGCGRMEHRYFEAVESGPVFGRLVSLNDWLDAEGARLMQDRLEYRFYGAPPSFRLLDMAVTFYASEGDVRFGDTKEGGFASVRVATSMDVEHTGRIENSLGGINETETWGKRAHWCDYSGQVGGETVGIAVFDSPSNLRHPTYWHVRDYGLMAANPFGLSHFVDENADGSYVLPEGGRLRFRYRIYIHAGDAQQGRVRDKYLEWAFPPSASVQGEP